MDNSPTPPVVYGDSAGALQLTPLLSGTAEVEKAPWVYSDASPPVRMGQRQEEDRQLSFWSTAYPVMLWLVLVGFALRGQFTEVIIQLVIAEIYFGRGGRS
jgi:hypothetical protein